MANLFDKRNVPPGSEFFETLLERDGVRLERIVSLGCTDGEWYDQSWDEWVVVMRGEAALEWEDGSEEPLTAGDHLLIPAHRRHRVVRTSYDCIWLALHLNGE